MRAPLARLVRSARFVVFFGQSPRRALSLPSATTHQLNPFPRARTHQFTPPKNVLLFFLCVFFCFFHFSEKLFSAPHHNAQHTPGKAKVPPAAFFFRNKTETARAPPALAGAAATVDFFFFSPPPFTTTEKNLNTFTTTLFPHDKNTHHMKKNSTSRARRSFFALLLFFSREGQKTQRRWRRAPPSSLPPPPTHTHQTCAIHPPLNHLSRVRLEGVTKEVNFLVSGVFYFFKPEEEEERIGSVPFFFPERSPEREGERERETRAFYFLLAIPSRTIRIRAQSNSPNFNRHSYLIVATTLAWWRGGGGASEEEEKQGGEL